MEQQWMRQAIALAKQGIGHVNPNPLVGAVIVKDGVVVGQGYHQQYGGPHAEVNAVRSANCDLTGATVYVTLEPCSHYGKTPPCADLLIAQKVGRVVIGSRDPNPLVAGRGIEKLRDAGIIVETDFLRSECDALNRVFFHYITTKTPYVVLKTAMSLDGKIATARGESKWITGEAARQDVQKLRHRLTGILVGIQTVLVDDPLLTCRLAGGRDPVRIIADSHLRIPLSARVLQNQQENPTILAATEDVDPQKQAELEAMGATVLRCRSFHGRVDLRDLMEKLGERKIDSILLEGGSALNDSALRQGIVQEVVTYIAPKLIGGDGAKTPVGGEGVACLADAPKVRSLFGEQIGEDWKLTGYLSSR
ncbi:MAG: bifunctional diaminohydroxyphosphoribosylaminopyrimidine deaminase/5-amino-6-(5-phosphoribosylamino)uracil reductase RibD [Oscillospiraceae bacterium]|nr:bifunctional diaminohydroxyphosphoribosylaminopyrimidine deaminase/5-amino-6-(5-phosphoribosylamino)uracil reductase RibD [Oscillospiraceae bacterium]